MSRKLPALIRVRLVCWKLEKILFTPPKSSSSAQLSRILVAKFDSWVIKRYTNGLQDSFAMIMLLHLPRKYLFFPL